MDTRISINSPAPIHTSSGLSERSALVSCIATLSDKKMYVCGKLNGILTFYENDLPLCKIELEHEIHSLVINEKNQLITGQVDSLFKRPFLQYWDISDIKRIKASGPKIPLKCTPYFLTLSKNTLIYGAFDHRICILAADKTHTVIPIFKEKQDRIMNCFMASVTPTSEDHLFLLSLNGLYQLSIANKTSTFVPYESAHKEKSAYPISVAKLSHDKAAIGDSEGNVSFWQFKEASIDKLLKIRPFGEEPILCMTFLDSTISLRYIRETSINKLCIAPYEIVNKPPVKEEVKKTNFLTLPQATLRQAPIHSLFAAIKEPIKNTPLLHGDSACMVSLNETGCYATGHKKAIKFWKIGEKEPLHTLTLTEDMEVISLALCPNELLLCGMTAKNERSRLEYWDIKNLKEPKKIGSAIHAYAKPEFLTCLYNYAWIYGERWTNKACAWLEFDSHHFEIDKKEWIQGAAKGNAKHSFIYLTQLGLYWAELSKTGFSQPTRFISHEDLNISGVSTIARLQNGYYALGSVLGLVFIFDLENKPRLIEKTRLGNAYVSLYPSLDGNVFYRTACSAGILHTADLKEIKDEKKLVLKL